MKFTVSHTIADITVNTFAGLFFDEPFNDALCQHLSLNRQVMNISNDGKHFSRMVRIKPEREMPAAAQKVLKQLGVDRISYTEHLTFDIAANEGTWRLEPAALAEKLQSQGRILFVQDGTGVKRIVEGEVSVKVFGLGGMIERLVVADVEKSYAEAAEYTRNWIRDGKGTGALLV